MKYRKRNIVKGVSAYQLKENWLIHDSGKELRKHELYLNNKNIGVEGEISHDSEVKNKKEENELDF